MATEKLVLVVEDDATVYPLVRAMILKLNPMAVIDYADSAEKASALVLGASAKKYDVIFSDVNLAGEKNGVDLVKDVYFKTGLTPIVLASADKEFTTHLPFLLKPLRFEDFAERMGPYLLDSKASTLVASKKWPLLAILALALAAAAYSFLKP
jgi:response regulator of citrate/malate metabolism